MHLAFWKKLDNLVKASKSSMLGLGDIVIPGILVALMLRLDNHVSSNLKKIM